MLSTHRFVQHRARAIVALLAAMLAALAIAACGGDDKGGGGGGDDAATLLRQTFSDSHEVRSGRVDARLRLTVDDPTIRGPVDISVSGPFQSDGPNELPQFDMTVDIEAQGQTFEVGLVATDDKAFVEISGTAYEVPRDLLAELERGFRRAQKEGSDDDTSLAALGIDPLKWLKDPSVEGSEDVGGVETKHITAGVDVPALLDDIDKALAEVDRQGLADSTGQDVPDRIPADARKEIEEAVKSARFDVWTGADDHILRRLRVVVSVEDDDERDGPRALDLELTVELTGLNEPQRISAPGNVRPLQELLGQLQGLLGGALGGDMGGLGAGSSDQFEEYTRCIEDAQGDVSRAQECADLLTR